MLHRRRYTKGIQLVPRKVGEILGHSRYKSINVGSSSKKHYLPDRELSKFKQNRVAIDKYFEDGPPKSHHQETTERGDIIERDVPVGSLQQ